ASPPMPPPPIRTCWSFQEAIEDCSARELIRSEVEAHYFSPPPACGGEGSGVGGLGAIQAPRKLHSALLRCFRARRCSRTAAHGSRFVSDKHRASGRA